MYHGVGFWIRLTAELTKLNLITQFDRGALATHCAAYALWAEAIVQIQEYGTMAKSPSGYPMQSLYIGLANREAELMMRIASEFGFTPASRSRISAPPPDQLPLLDLTAESNAEEEPEGRGVGQSLADDRPRTGPTFIQVFFLPRQRFCASNPDISSRPSKSIDVTNTYGVAKLIAHEKRRECGIIFPPLRMPSVSRSFAI
jgi:P27 family predicted phage terminase small subunit